MAVNTLQRIQLNLMTFSFQIQRLTAAHTGDTAGLSQFRDHRDAVTVRYFRHWSVADNGECQRLQRISGQDRVCLTKFYVASRQTAAQVIVVHRG